MHAAHLTEDQRASIDLAAQLLSPSSRKAFVADVNTALAREPIVGDGASAAC